MREYKLSSSRGKALYNMGNKCCWRSLYNLYGRWSNAKQVAFDCCWEKYMATENHEAFGVGNANSFAFMASWLGTKNGEDIMRVETKDNSYLIWINRQEEKGITKFEKIAKKAELLECAYNAIIEGLLSKQN